MEIGSSSSGTRFASLSIEVRRDRVCHGLSLSRNLQLISIKNWLGNYLIIFPLLQVIFRLHNLFSIWISVEKGTNKKKIVVDRDIF